MIVRLAREAEQDLGEIATYIARDSLAAALSFTAALREACLGIGAMSRAFPIIERYEALRLRRRSYRGYSILYRIDPEEIVVIRIVHGARDLDLLLKS